MVKRQERVEAQVEVLKKMFRFAAEESYILPAALKRWERISREIDDGSGRSFSSAASMKKWLTAI